MAKVEAPVKVIEESKDEEMPVPPPKDSAEKTDATVEPQPTTAKPAKPWLAKKQPEKELQDSSAKADSAVKVETADDVVMKEEEPKPDVKPFQDT